MYSEYQNYKNIRLGYYKNIRLGLAPTPPDIEGPFWKANAPFIPMGKLEEEADLHISGRVLSTNGQPIIGAVLDFWQADEHGVYDNNGYTLRGKVKSDELGEYIVHTIVPGDYAISEKEFRCSHIHVIIEAPGYKKLTTQLYFADDKYNATDHWFDSRRVIDIPNGHFDFVLESL